MSEAYREEARERLKNCVGARFSAEALVIALAGGRIGQSDWSVECDRIISLLDDDDDYRRGFNDGLKANTKAAFAAAKQAISERTCKVYRVGNTQDLRKCSACDALISFSHPLDRCHLNYCTNCGARVVEE